MASDLAKLQKDSITRSAEPADIFKKEDRFFMTLRGFRIPLAIVMVLAATACLKAASITWFGPQNITGNTDVKTNGTLFQAVDFGTTSATTVNGVTFSGFSVGSGTSSITVGNINLVGTGTQVAGRQLRQGAFSSGSAPFSTLSGSYQNLVGPGIYSQNGTPAGTAAKITVTITGLSVGQQYDVQYWVNDPRGVQDTVQRQVQIGSQLLSLNTSGTTGGTGQWVLGTFIADGSSQSFDVTGVSSGTVGPVAYANAMQVRVVPEPSTIIMAASGSLAILGLIKARRKRLAKAAA